VFAKRSARPRHCPAWGRSRRTNRRSRNAGRGAAWAAIRAAPIGAPGHPFGRCELRSEARFQPARLGATPANGHSRSRRSFF
jgi:hypothetical protein